MIWIFALIGLFCGILQKPVFERLPAKWLCDFGESSDEISKKERILPLKAAFALAFAVALLFVLLYLQMGLNLKFFVCCLISFPVFLCILSDIKYQILPTQLCAIIALAGLSLTVTKGLSGLAGGLVGAILSGGAFYLLGMIGQFVYKREALGFGDVYFAAALGLFFPYFKSLWIFALTVISASLCFGMLTLCGKLKKDSTTALGPYIGIGFFAVLSFQSQLDGLVRWYIGLL